MAPLKRRPDTRCVKTSGICADEKHKLFSRSAEGADPRTE
jgi:hypothetical protein